MKETPLSNCEKRFLLRAIEERKVRGERGTCRMTGLWLVLTGARLPRWRRRFGPLRVEARHEAALFCCGKNDLDSRHAFVWHKCDFYPAPHYSGIAADRDSVFSLMEMGIRMFFSRHSHAWDREKSIHVSHSLTSLRLQS